MEGWIKVYRKLQDWEWYQDSKMVHLFIHLLIEANHEPRRWKGIEIQPGQMIFGRKKLSRQLGVSERSIRTCIERLKTTNEVTIKTTNKFSLLTIENYRVYQSSENKTTSKTTSKTTNKRPANDQQTTTPKELKNERIVSTNVETTTHPLQIFIRDNYPNISKLKNQLTEKEASRIVSKFDKLAIKQILDAMENKADLPKKYTSVNLTIQNWIRFRNENQTKPNEPKPLQKVSAEDPYAAFAG